MKILNAKKFAKIYFLFIVLLALSTYFIGNETNAKQGDETMISSVSDQVQENLKAESQGTLN